MNRRIFVAIALLSATSPLQAADTLPAFVPQPTPQGGGPTFSFSPYFWAAGIDGNTAVFGLPSVKINQSFGDILKDLDFSFMGAGEARFDRWSVFSDITYVRITTGSAISRGVIANEVNLKSETFTATLGAGYSIIDQPDTRLDLVGGLKVWSVETTISFTGGILGGISKRDDATWVDGMAGFRGMYSITPEIYLTGVGLIGAGGADIDWDLMGGVGYKFSDRISAVAGYRALGVNYSRDGLTEDIVEHGPILGTVFRF